MTQNWLQYEYQCCSNINALHWSRIPEDWLHESGYIHSFNQQRLSRFSKIPDVGFDFMIREEVDNEIIYHGGQCKHYSTNVCLKDVGTFFIKQGLLHMKNNNSIGYLYTSGEISPSLKETILAYSGRYVHVKCPFQETIDNIILDQTNETVMPRRDYQIEIKKKALEYFKENCKIILQAFCGSGKTIITGDILMELQPDVILCLAPEKTQVENLRSRLINFLDTYDYILFDSDSSLGGTTQLDKLSSKLNESKRCIIFTTFISAEVILNATFTTNKFDKIKSSFVVVDEVHNIFNKTKLCTLVDKLNKGLFLTATPPIDLYKKLYFDKEIKYGFDYGLKHKYICDYTVWLPSIQYNHDKSCNAINIPVEISDIDNTSLIGTKALFLFNSMLKTGSRRCIVYLDTSEETERFLKCFKEIGDKYHSIPTWGKSILHNVSVKKRYDIIKDFESGDDQTFKILTSCGCLDEAVDIVRCDSEFLTTIGITSSSIRTVQRLMRGARLDYKNPLKINNLFIWTEDYIDCLHCLTLLKENDIDFVKKVKISEGNYERQYTKQSIKDIDFNIKILENIIVNCNTWEEKALLKWKDYCEWAIEYCDKNSIKIQDFYPRISIEDEKFLTYAIEDYRGALRGVKTSTKSYESVNNLIKNYEFGHWIELITDEEKAIKKWSRLCLFAKEFCDKNRLEYKQYFPNSNSKNEEENELGRMVGYYRTGIKGFGMYRVYDSVNRMIIKYDFKLWLKINTKEEKAIERWELYCNWAKEYCDKNRIEYKSYKPSGTTLEGTEKKLLNAISDYRKALSNKGKHLKYDSVTQMIKDYGFIRWIN